MSRKNVSLFILIALLLAVGSIAYAQETCPDCGEPVAYDDPAPCPHNWIELGVAFNDVDGSTAAMDRDGKYPADWLTSGRLNLGGESLRKERFELRWDDANADSWRAWNRLGYHPVTLEWDAVAMSGYAWDARGAAPALQGQDVSMDRIELRVHRGELDNMRLGYERGEWNRSAGGLGSYSFNRLDYQYNFKLSGEKLRGQFKTVATEYDAPVVGIESGNITTSTLKLDSKLSCDWSAYAKAAQTTYKYDEMADSEATGSDMTLGLRWRPAPIWELDANYRTKSNADDNVAGSHVSGLDEYGFSLSAVPCNGNRYEFGYAHRSVDYTRLRSEDPAVEDILFRGTAAATPGQLAGHYDSLEPEQDRYWFSLRHKLSDKLSFKSRWDYVNGDAPQSTIPTTYSPSLFSDKRIKHTESLNYSYNSCNQFGLTYHGQKAYYDTRDTDYGLDYMEGTWSHSFGEGKNFLLAYRETHTDLDIPTVASVYNSDDKTYLANFSHELPNFRYAFDLALTDGSGYEQYNQTALGADFGFKRFGPLGLRVDWIDRQYDNAAGFDTQALQLALTYKFEF